MRAPDPNQTKFLGERIKSAEARNVVQITCAGCGECCTCHRQGDRRWVQLPSKPLIDETGLVVRDQESGKIRYTPVLVFDAREVLRRFSTAACAALNAYHQGWDR